MLIYPAFLGAFIFGYYENFGKNSTEQNWLGLLMLIYFGCSFVETETTQSECYGIRMFLLDVIEVGLMVAAFCFLKLSADAVTATEGTTEGSTEIVKHFVDGPTALLIYYLLMVGVFCSSLLWRWWIDELVQNFLNVLAFLAALVFGVGAGYAPIYGRHWSLLIWIAWILLVIYLLYFFFVRAAFGHGKTGTICSLSGEYVAHHLTTNGEVTVNRGEKFPLCGAETCEWELRKPKAGWWPFL